MILLILFPLALLCLVWNRKDSTEEMATVLSFPNSADDSIEKPSGIPFLVPFVCSLSVLLSRRQTFTHDYFILNTRQRFLSLLV